MDKQCGINTFNVKQTRLKTSRLKLVMPKSCRLTLSGRVSKLFWMGTQMRARSTDRDKLTASQQFRHSDLVTDFITVILPQSEGLGKMALGIVKYAYDHSSQLIGVIWVGSRSVVVDTQNRLHKKVHRSTNATRLLRKRNQQKGGPK